MYTKLLSETRKNKFYAFFQEVKKLTADIYRRCFGDGVIHYKLMSAEGEADGDIQSVFRKTFLFNDLL